MRAANPIATAPKDHPILVSFRVGRSDQIAEGEVRWNPRLGGFEPTECIASLLYPAECLGWREVEAPEAAAVLMGVR